MTGDACGCEAVAEISSPEASLFLGVRGQRRWPLLSPTIHDDQGRRYLRGRIDDLNDNQLHALAKGLCHGPSADPYTFLLRLRMNRFFRIFFTASVGVVRCPIHKAELARVA